MDERRVVISNERERSKIFPAGRNDRIARTDCDVMTQSPTQAQEASVPHRPENVDAAEFNRSTT
jgi:hypothetical protein